ncbi:unnamed protein product, partial [Staurois parvus]
MLCCQVQSVSWGPCTAALPLLLSHIATLCHVPLSGLLTLLVGFHFVIGCMADYGPPISAARPCNVIWSWAPVLPPHLAARSTDVSWVPVRPPHCCCLHRHSLLHVPLSVSPLTAVLVPF